jgi:hypothetical protein
MVNGKDVLFGSRRVGIVLDGMVMTTYWARQWLP